MCDIASCCITIPGFWPTGMCFHKVVTISKQFYYFSTVSFKRNPSEEQALSFILHKMFTKLLIQKCTISQKEKQTYGNTYWLLTPSSNPLKNSSSSVSLNMNVTPTEIMSMPVLLPHEVLILKHNQHHSREIYEVL
jgi:hypothetical protein